MESLPEPGVVRPAVQNRKLLEEVFGSNEGAQVPRLKSALSRQLFEYVLEKPSATSLTQPGKILIVDQDLLSREILARNLHREGYLVELEENGPRALERLAGESFDLVLWEVQLPDLSGLDMLNRVRKDPHLQHLPVVLLSDSKDAEMIIPCIEAGADDYLPKPFNPALLKARIRNCTERKRLRDEERRLHNEIKSHQERIRNELIDAKTYLMSLLPPPIQEPFVTDWRFIPSGELGGDSFGYHWIDDDHFAIYLLDVCGHGVGAALLSVTVLNVLRSNALNGVDFRNPSEVLGAANRAFPMEEQNNRYFTLWYGIYQRSTRKLSYSSGGHPPALLFEPGSVVAKKLSAHGMMVGGMSTSRYQSLSCDVPRGSRLFLFCDGAYEITLPDGSLFTLDQFADLLGKLPAEAPVDLDGIIDHLRKIGSSREMEDDLSLITIQF